MRLLGWVVTLFLRAGFFVALTCQDNIQWAPAHHTHLHMNYPLLLSYYINYGLLRQSPSKGAKEVMLI